MNPLKAKPVSAEKSSLSSSEKAFFTLVKQAPLVNPFSRERENVEKEIAASCREAHGKKLVDKAVNAVEIKIGQLREEGRANLSLFQGEDRDLLEYGFTFVFFYKFRKKFDDLILDQINTGDVPIRAAFLKSAFTCLEDSGFDREYALKVVEGCYQLRRAFFFIKRSLVGQSESMKKLRLKLWNNVFTHNFDLYRRLLWNRMEDFSTLILGETGTGKGTAAAAIGRSGYIPFDMRKQCFVESFTKSFVSLNLSQFPESLIESELFGHQKGAFTGAVDDHKGVFARCSPYGAIFLDEIGEVSIPVQIKLLQVIQDREFSPVGSHRKERFNGRVIAATNRSIDDLRGKGAFRDDFYYRLCSDVITVPPLRQRIEEDPRELDYLLELIVKRTVGESSSELAGLAKDVIRKELGPGYPWPGNVRELEQCVRRVILNKKYKGDTKVMRKETAGRIAENMQSGDMSAHDLVASYCHLLYGRYGTFEEVARRTKLDRRTVKKYIEEWKEKEGGTEQFNDG